MFKSFLTRSKCLPPDTKELARKLLASGDLDKEGYSLQDLFKIRDACIMLARFGLQDQDLLNETLKYIEQKVGE